MQILVMMREGLVKQGNSYVHVFCFVYHKTAATSLANAEQHKCSILYQYTCIIVHYFYFLTLDSCLIVAIKIKIWFNFSGDKTRKHDVREQVSRHLVSYWNASKNK